MGPQQKARRREKRLKAAAEYQAACDAVRATGASCGSCAHMERGNYCELDSDFYGKAVVEKTNVCPRWKPRQ